MEVHHSHSSGHKKKWTGYLLEFLMLFLAVFLGFTAENIREHQVERHREKDYIKSFLGDLRSDTANLSYVSTKYQLQIKRQDTLLQISDTIQSGFSKQFWGLLPSITYFPDFIYSDATIQQLKNAGGFRLIKNKAVVDSINFYSAEVSRLFLNTNSLGNWLHDIHNVRLGFFNYKVILNALARGLTHEQMEEQKLDVLISHDKQHASNFFNKVMNYQWIMKVILGQFIKLKEHAERLILFIETEYNLH